MGIISSAIEQPEFQQTVEFMAKRAANLGDTYPLHHL